MNAKKLFSFILCIVMLISMLPVFAFAEEQSLPEEGETVEAEETSSITEEKTENVAPAEVKMLTTAEDDSELPSSDIVGGSCGDNLQWEYDSKTGTLLIKGSGDMWNWEDPDYGDNLAPWNDYKGKIEKVSIEAGVTSIGDYAFYDFSKITGMLLPEGIKRIGVYSFYNCGGITSITLPQSTEIIDASAFSECSALTSVTIPENVTSIEYGIFSNCSSLESVTIKGKVSIIGASAFYGCSSLTSMTIPDSVIRIDNSAFFSCQNLSDLTLNDGLTEIGIHAFGGCYALRSVTIPKSVKNIEIRAFYNPVASVGSIGLQSIYFKGGPPTIASNAFENATADAYYIDDGSWQKEDMLDYGGTLTWKPVNPGSRFADVSNPNEYYYTPVYWAADKGITTGYSDGTFGVGKNCQRREVMIFLWRFAGCPSGYGDARNMFNDLGTYAPSSATNQAIAWAYTEGISKGYPDGGFHPTASIVRKDVMIMLYRLAGKPAVSGTLTFTDCTKLNKNSDTYRAILWGSQNGITKGYNSGPYKGQFGNSLNCLREQIVTFLYRYNSIAE